MITRFEKALMQRDGISRKEALQKKNEASDMLQKHLNNNNIHGAYDVCAEFGLEPDYLIDLV